METMGSSFTAAVLRPWLTPKTYCQRCHYNTAYLIVILAALAQLYSVHLPEDHTEVRTDTSGRARGAEGVSVVPM